MTSSNPIAFACSAFVWLVVLDMACFAPKARANCVTALPTDPRSLAPERFYRDENQRGYQGKQPFASWRNVRAMLDVHRRPGAFCCCVVAFVEKRIEGFENDRLVLFGCCLGHIQLLELSLND